MKAEPTSTWPELRAERDADICRRYGKGESQASIARLHGLTRQRVAQLLKALRAKTSPSGRKR